MKLLIALVCSATVAQARKMFEGNLWKFLEPESDSQFKVVDIYQRERPSFLQGIEYLGDDLFIESSGMYGESETSYSSIDGNVIKAESTVPMDDSIFGEGICTLPGAKSFIRLHWQDKIMDILDSSLKTIDSIPMFEGPAQGWGITRDLRDETLYVTDGSSTVFKYDGSTFDSKGQFDVVLPSGRKLNYVNELEYVDGQIWANIFTTDYVVRFDPATGLVNTQIDFHSLLKTEKKFNTKTNDRMKTWDYGNNVLNGIAYDPASGDYFLTGKRWSLMFRVQITPKE